MSPIPRLSRPPSRSLKPDTFSGDMDQTFQDMNATIDAWNDQVDLLNAGQTGTSTTSLTIGAATQAPVVQTGLGFVKGSTVFVASAADPTNSFIGKVTGYDATTGAMSIAVQINSGSGTHADWYIGLSLAQPQPRDFFRNRLINGDMRIDQRHAGAAVNGIAGGVYTVDRWCLFGTQAAKLQAQRFTTTPSASFTHSLGLTTLAAVSPGSTDNFQLHQAVEGLNVADLGWGTSQAADVAVSFYFKSTVAGAYSLSFTNAASNRSLVTSFTVAANAWTFVSLIVPGDTSGTWANDNTAGLYLRISLGAGTTFQASSANSWAAGNFTGLAGQVQLVATASAQMLLTGVQLEAGDTPTSFEHRPVAQELALCQRYYEKSYNANVAQGGASIAGRTLIGLQTTDGTFYGTLPFKVTKRAVPTLNVYDTAGSAYGSGFAASENSIDVNGSAALTANHFLAVQFAADAEL